VEDATTLSWSSAAVSEWVMTGYSVHLTLHVDCVLAQSRSRSTVSPTRNTFCRSRSLSDATFSFATSTTFKICFCVQTFIEIGWFFTEIWRYNDFQNGSHPPSWNCFTTIQDHPRSLCCWPQLPIKFHVSLIHRYKDRPIAIWIFRIFGLKCLFRPPKWGFLGDFGP